MWPNPQFPADLVTYTEEILDEKLDFLCSACYKLLNVWWSLDVVVSNVNSDWCLLVDLTYKSVGSSSTDRFISK